MTPPPQTQMGNNRSLVPQPRQQADRKKGGFGGRSAQPSLAYPPKMGRALAGRSRPSLAPPSSIEYQETTFPFGPRNSGQMRKRPAIEDVTPRDETNGRDAQIEELDDVRMVDSTCAHGRTRRRKVTLVRPVRPVLT